MAYLSGAGLPSCPGKRLLNGRRSSSASHNSKCTGKDLNILKWSKDRKVSELSHYWYKSIKRKLFTHKEYTYGENFLREESIFHSR